MQHDNNEVSEISARHIVRKIGNARAFAAFTSGEEIDHTAEAFIAIELLKNSGNTQ